MPEPSRKDSTSPGRPIRFCQLCRAPEAENLGVYLHESWCPVLTGVSPPGKPGQEPGNQGLHQGLYQHALNQAQGAVNAWPGLISQAQESDTATRLLHELDALNQVNRRLVRELMDAWVEIARLREERRSAL